MSKRTTKKAFADWDENDVFAAWDRAVRKAIGDCRIARGVLAPTSSLVKDLKKGIRRQMAAGRGFSAADLRASKRVATDLGKTCRLFALAAKDRTVTQDMFDAIALLRKSHPSCPPSAQLGAGPWC